MRAVLQRVSEASVTVEGSEVGSIGAGLLVLAAVGHDDTAADAAALAEKIADLRIFRDAADKMNLSVLDAGGNALVISQFTLYANVRKGRRPSFVAAAEPDRAEALIGELIDGLRARGLPVETGRFGERMVIRLVNDGPVTIILETQAGRIV